jgi:hypothetical protein
VYLFQLQLLTIQSAGNTAADSSGAGVATSGGSGTAYTVKLAHESGLTIGGGFEEADDFARKPRSKKCYWLYLV